ncbi:MAG: molybdopterin molybdotransferase MoeA, partial [Crocinitomicaceae bacterium]|nr:molybdopterin molybdotransferase MoeA [Crocinitomicaceae bacterium]
MISVQEALQNIEKNSSINQPEKRLLKNSLNYILAEDVFSPIDMPPFRQSAMDGYAVNFDTDILQYRLAGEIPAGSSENFNLKKGEAVRIYTGSAVPDTANCVVQQEIVVVENDHIKFTSEVKLSMNIRQKGEQIQQKAVALKKGDVLNPAAIGFLATLGLTEVLVYSKPKIFILTTGSELINPGETLRHGQIFESNSIMISSLLHEKGFTDVTIERVKDDLEDTIKKIKEALELCDLLLISGGISVGDYDFVKEALKQNNVNEHFHKIRQKPGKPILFGTKGKKMIFALPGNPASALTCLYIYVLPALNKVAGKQFAG